MVEYNYFEFEGIKIEYSALLNMLNTDNIPAEYSGILYQSFDNTFILTYNGKYAYIYKSPIKVIIQIGNTNIDLLMHSNIDIETYCKNNNLNVNNIYYEDGELFASGLKIIPRDINEIKLINKDRKELPSQEKNKTFDVARMYMVNEYSKYFKYYFGYDISANTVFLYRKTETRKKIFMNLYKLSSSTLKKFKFTGPFNIGKSITLLQYSRLNENVFYINLKVLKVLYNESERDCYILLKEEFSRISKFVFDTIQETIDKNYKEGTDPIDLIFIIIDTLSKSSMIFVFIFDQYKNNSFSPIHQQQLENLSNNIKIVYCSSINNYNIKKNVLTAGKKVLLIFKN